MNSEEINLTTSEIAKAFQILRKYRYTFTSPARKPVICHNEAESTNVGKPPRKSLPYLDLADSCTPSSNVAPSKSVKDNKIKHLKEMSTLGISEDNDIICEVDIDEYRSCNPFHCTVSITVITS